MKKIILILLLYSFTHSCGSDRTDEPTPPAVTYTQADAVGTWKATHYQRDPEGADWHKENNNRTITYKTDGNFTSYFLTESYTTELSGKYTIDAKGNVSTTNLNVSDRTASMVLTTKTDAILYINSSSPAIKVKYKVKKQ